jgi:hypothetical protein
MNVTCYIRQTKEWAEQYKFSDDIYSSFWNANKIANVWNEIFNISYIDFRKQLNNIQKENFKDIQFDFTINQYENINDSIIVPTDDDDWLHPNIIKDLKSIHQPVMFWNFINYNQGIISIHDSSKEIIQFESNNYAIDFKNEEILRNHVYANNVMKNKGLYIDLCLSMHNRTLASLSLLKGKSRSEVLDLYDVYRKPIIINGNIPPYFMKYIDKMVDIYNNKLKVRKLFI